MPVYTANDGGAIVAGNSAYFVLVLVLVIVLVLELAGSGGGH